MMVEAQKSIIDYNQKYISAKTYESTTSYNQTHILNIKLNDQSQTILYAD